MSSPKDINRLKGYQALAVTVCLFAAVILLFFNVATIIAPPIYIVLGHIIPIILIVALSIFHVMVGRKIREIKRGSVD